MIEATSNLLSTLSQLNESLFETIEPWLKGRILEVNSTTESVSRLFVPKKLRIHLSNPDPNIRSYLTNKYQGDETIRMVHPFDFRQPEPEKAYPKELRIFDTIIALNSLRNSPVDKTFVENVKCLLRERGRFIFMAPIHTALFGDMAEDQNILKRYNRSELKHILTENLKMLAAKYFKLIETPVYNWSGLSVIAVARKIRSSDSDESDLQT